MKKYISMMCMLLLSCQLFSDNSQISQELVNFSQQLTSLAQVLQQQPSDQQRLDSVKVALNDVIQRLAQNKEPYPQELKTSFIKIYEQYIELKQLLGLQQTETEYSQWLNKVLPPPPPGGGSTGGQTPSQSEWRGSQMPVPVLPPPPRPTGDGKPVTKPQETFKRPKFVKSFGGIIEFKYGANASYEVGAEQKDNGIYDILIFAPTLKDNFNPKDFYKVEYNERKKKYEISVDYPQDKIVDPIEDATGQKRYDQVAMRPYTLAENVKDDCAGKPEQYCKSLWDWQSDKVRNDWLKTVEFKFLPGGAIKTYILRSHTISQSGQSVQNLKKYLENIKQMYETQVQNVPMELKYVDYLYRVKALLEKVVNQYENDYDRDVKGLAQEIKGMKEQLAQKINDMEQQLNWPMKQLLYQLLHEDDQESSQPSQSIGDIFSGMKIPGGGGDQGGDQGGDEDDDDDFDDKEVEIRYQLDQIENDILTLVDKQKKASGEQKTDLQAKIGKLNEEKIELEAELAALQG